MKSLYLTAFITSCVCAHAEPNGYDPLKVCEGEVASLIYDPEDTDRDRVIPLRVYLPEDNEPAPVVIFSHGLGGSRDNNPYLGNHWAKRGYVVVYVQHLGSDESVWVATKVFGKMFPQKTG